MFCLCDLPFDCLDGGGLCSCFSICIAIAFVSVFVVNLCYYEFAWNCLFIVWWMFSWMFCWLCDLSIDCLEGGFCVHAFLFVIVFVCVCFCWEYLCYYEFCLEWFANRLMDVIMDVLLIEWSFNWLSWCFFLCVLAFLFAIVFLSVFVVKLCYYGFCLEWFVYGLMDVFMDVLLIVWSFNWLSWWGFCVLAFLFCNWVCFYCEFVLLWVFFRMVCLWSDGCFDGCSVDYVIFQLIVLMGVLCSCFSVCNCICVCFWCDFVLLWV